jgi:hypothetical protein
MPTSADAEREQFKDCYLEELQEAHPYYLVPAKWLRAWREYVGLDCQEDSHSCEKPGEITTIDLVDTQSSDAETAGEQADVDAQEMKYVQLKPDLFEGILIHCGKYVVLCGSPYRESHQLNDNC